MSEVNSFVAVSDTGPLISAFQSNSFHLLTAILGVIHTTERCVAELVSHGWEEALAQAGSDLIRHQLTLSELESANEIAQQIAAHHVSKQRGADDHLGEAEAIVLARRAEFSDAVLVLDEQAAREVAREMGVSITGFAGVLLVSVNEGLVTAEDVRDILQRCRQQGTHYSDSFIERIYQAAKGRWMMSNKGNVHEPQAELLSAEEAFEDAARLREKLRRNKPERVISIHVPLWALLEALDFLEPLELQQVAQRAQERLGVSGGS